MGKVVNVRLTENNNNSGAMNQTPAETTGVMGPGDGVVGTASSSDGAAGQAKMFAGSRKIAKRRYNVHNNQKRNANLRITLSGNRMNAGKTGLRDKIMSAEQNLPESVDIEQRPSSAGDPPGIFQDEIDVTSDLIEDNPSVLPDFNLDSSDVAQEPCDADVNGEPHSTNKSRRESSDDAGRSQTRMTTKDDNVSRVSAATKVTNAKSTTSSMFSQHQQNRLEQKNIKLDNDEGYKVVLISGENTGVNVTLSVILLSATILLFGLWGLALYYILTPADAVTTEDSLNV